MPAGTIASFVPKWTCWLHWCLLVVGDQYGQVVKLVSLASRRRFAAILKHFLSLLNASPMQAGRLVLSTLKIHCRFSYTVIVKVALRAIVKVLFSIIVSAIFVVLVVVIRCHFTLVLI